MMDDSRCSPSREGRPAHPARNALPARAPLLDLRHEAASSLAADRPRRLPDEYEDQWELNFLSHLAREMYEGDGGRQRYAEEEEGRRRQESRGKSRKKGLSKYKAYAVKMKIPSYHELARPRTRDARNGDTLDCKNRPDPRALYEPPSVSRMEEVFRANVRDIAIAHIFDSSNGNIFKKRPAKAKNPAIRKRSIKTTEKRRGEDEEAKTSLNKFLKTSTSPKLAKKCVVSLEQSSLDPLEPLAPLEAHSASFKEPEQLRKTDTAKSKKAMAFVKTAARSPLKEVPDATSKLLEKAERAIHFKKKDKSESPAKLARELTSEQAEKSPGGEEAGQASRVEAGQASRAAMRTIYTSKDVIRSKAREGGEGQKVFIFNSEDNYIKRLLGRGGWVHNHDHRSHFYHLKWVFKPDAIDYNLKPAQFVNHVKNSHELTAKHYLNKNLKAALSAWPALYSLYPPSYDFAKPAERQDFYAHFQRELMMTLLQNAYDHLLAARPAHVRALTRLYQALLQDDGSYGAGGSGSPLRKKQFRKIEMEDYRQYDDSCLLHMNLLIVALRYWRGLRKGQQLDHDDHRHFLAFREAEFQDHLQQLERYSKLPPGYSPQTAQYFEREFFATPSETAIARVVKEYVYFQRQLGRQWRVFGRGNVWIVKPCSASRGTGIYLADDCAEILTDTRGIQSKVVQRYIERPLLLQSGAGRGRKFDLRQWVLLRSVQPLQIYMFSHCYLRVCSEEYGGDIGNLKAHLTNYSFNKRHFQQPGESVIDQDTFQALLLQERRVNFTQTVRPKIKEIVVRSIKATQHLISDCGHACFSLLGYDILLDDDCQPWLLEVNMSPACEERTDWLRTYLDVMGRELLKIVLPQDYTANLAKPSARGSQLPARKHSQGEDAGLQLKKMKTEVSQFNEGEGSYVNAAFELAHPHLELAHPHLELAHPHLESEAAGRESTFEFGEMITYEDFMNENASSKAESEGGGKGEGREQSGKGREQSGKGECEWKVLSASNNDISPGLGQKFAHLELYLDDRKGNPSPAASPPPSRLNASEVSLLKLESELRWERICLEEYGAGRKDGETHFEVTGNKLPSAAIHEIDRAVEQAEEERRLITQSCTSLQRAIRKYLDFARNARKPSAENTALCVNISRLRQGEFRESKSALYNHQQRSWWPRESGTQPKLERPITARNSSNPPSAKHRGSDTFREKIRSIALQAAARDNRPIAQEICSSQASLGPPQ